MKRTRKQRFVLIFLFIVTAGISCLFGWRVMPRVWKWTKGLFSAPIAVEKEPYIPSSTASLQDTFAASDSVIYYFYKDNCPYCVEIEGLFKGLPSEITLPDGPSQVKLVCVNKNTHPEICEAYYAQAGIPENQRFVPAVVVGNEYLFAPAEIMEGMYACLLRGEGLITPMMGDNHRE